MNESGRKAVTFVFAGYKKEMDEFVQYNAGLESRIKYRFHFDDYSVPELVTIINIKIKAKGYKLTPDADKHLPQACRAPCPGRASAPINRMVRHRADHREGDERRLALQVQRPSDRQLAAVVRACQRGDCATVRCVTAGARLAGRRTR